VNSLFCRHNRFTADCPICSKGTVLDPSRQATRPRAPRQASSRGRASTGTQKFARVVAGPYASTGPYEDDLGDSYEVRLEKVPGGVRLAEWAAGQIRRSAPVLAAGDLGTLLLTTRERSLLSDSDSEALLEAATTEPEGGAGGKPFGTSRGRTGDMQEELRVEPLGEGRVRIGRWILRPGADWELQHAPVMLPAKRYAEAIRAAARAGLLH
jgi:hypothetical protein